MSKSKIEWTDETWNVTTGCTRVSAGCDNCYAVRMTKRLANIGSTKEKYGGLVNEGKDHFNGKIKLHPDVLEEPLHWQKPRRVFVNSMSDLFHPEVPFEFIAAVFGVMIYCKDHTFQVLTKRPDRMAEFFAWLENGEITNQDGSVVYDYDMPRKCIQFAISELDHKETLLMGMTNVNGREWPAPNIWLGTSVENQEAADERIPYLLDCAAAVRFLSCEPLLGKLNLRPYDDFSDKGHGPSYLSPSINAAKWPGIDWVIAGGESGPGARPMHPDWLRLLRDQCTTVDTAFFFKQWGKWVSEFHPAASPSEMETSNKFVTYVDEDHNDVDSREVAVDYYGQYMVNVGKKKAGRELDGKVWNQFPEVKDV